MKIPDKKNPFEVPKGYFKGFNERLMERLAKEDSPVPKKDGFTVPENYFESLTGSILKKLEPSETKVIPLNSYKKYYLAAASIAAMVLVFLGFDWNTQKELTFENLAASDIERYFENNGLDMTTYEIAEVIPVDELEINDILVNKFDEENVLDYLNENIEDFESLNLENDE